MSIMNQVIQYFVDHYDAHGRHLEWFIMFDHAYAQLKDECNAYFDDHLSVKFTSPSFDLMEEYIMLHGVKIYSNSELVRTTICPRPSRN